MTEIPSSDPPTRGQPRDRARAPEESPRRSGAGRDAVGPRRTSRLLTVPNSLCLLRLFGSPLLIVLAIADQTFVFLGWFLTLAMTDWIDGKIARYFNQRSTLGPRLDSWADATLYGCLLIGALWLEGAVMAAEWGWIAAAIGSYALTTAAGIWKFGRWPSYHTRAAKASWFFMLLGVACLMADISVWPFRIAMGVVTLTNLEATLITTVLTQWRSDVPSIWSVKRRG